MNRRIFLTSIAAGAASAGHTFAAPKPQRPVFIDPAFHFADVGEIDLLPAVDLRVKKVEKGDKQLTAANSGAINALTRFGYQATSRAGELQLLDDDLKSPSEAFIRKLGPEGAHWVLVVALEDAEAHKGFGTTGSAIVMGALFDKEKGKLVWRDIGTGKVGQGGLIGLAMPKGAMTEEAISQAMYNLFSTFEKRKRKKGAKA